MKYSYAGGQDRATRHSPGRGCLERSDLCPELTTSPDVYYSNADQQEADNAVTFTRAAQED